MCVWKVAENDRMCGYCLYRGCVERFRPKRNAADVCSRYARIMNGLFGLDVLEKTRKREAVWGRNMIAMQMCLDGYIQEDIGRCLGKDRCTIVHCLQSVEDMLDRPNLYQVEYGIWKEFKEIIKRDEQVTARMEPQG